MSRSKSRPVSILQAVQSVGNDRRNDVFRINDKHCNVFRANDKHCDYPVRIQKFRPAAVGPSLELPNIDILFTMESNLM